VFKTFNITKKLAVTFSTKLTSFNFGSFTLIKINTDNFIDYRFNIVMCNCMLRITYENTKQREDMKRLCESISELEKEE
jgi:hypothetical protein